MITHMAASATARLMQIDRFDDNFVDDGADGVEGFFAELGLDGWIGDILTVLVILAIGLAVAFIARAVVSKLINATPFGRRAQTTGGNIGKAVGKAVFWVLVLYTVFIALARLDFAGSALSPVEGLLADIGTFIPKLIAAGFILFVGYIVAKVAKTATTSTLDAAGVDGWMNRTGVTAATGSTGSLSGALGTIVFVLIIIPVIIAALDVLDIESISGPLTNLLETFLAFIPRIIGAAIVLGLAILIGRFISNFLQSILPTFGFDRSVNEIMMLDDGKATTMQPSKIAGTVAFIIVTVLGLAAAISVLGIETLDNAFGAILDLGGRVLTAAVTIIAGVFLANFVSRIIGGATGSSMGTFLKYAIIVLVSFMALSQLGIGDGVVEILFASLAIGASVAASIAFGVGGTNWAKEVLNSAAPPKKVGQSIQESASSTAQAVKTAAARTRTATSRAKPAVAAPKATTASPTRTTKAAPKVAPKVKPKTPRKPKP